MSEVEKRIEELVNITCDAILSSIASNMIIPDKSSFVVYSFVIEGIAALAPAMRLQDAVLFAWDITDIAMKAIPMGGDDGRKYIKDTLMKAIDKMDKGLLGNLENKIALNTN